MQFKSVSRVTSMKPSKGEFEGRPYDSTKVFVETGVASDSEGFGYVTVSYNWGLSDNYHDFVRSTGINKPFDAEITWENIVAGNGSKLVLVDLKPVTAPQTQPKA